MCICINLGSFWRNPQLRLMLALCVEVLIRLRAPSGGIYMCNTYMYLYIYVLYIYTAGQLHMFI